MEYIVLKSLVEIGKWLFVVFNKIDFYMIEDYEVILVWLRERLVGVVSKMDIVVIVVCFNFVKLEIGEVY